jgi:uncharacterized protein
LSSFDHQDSPPQPDPSTWINPPDAVSADPFPPPIYIPIPVAPPVVRDPVWSGWDVALITFLTLVTIFVTQLATVLVAWRFVYPHTSFADVAQKSILILVSQFLSYIAVAVFMVMFVEGKYKKPFWPAIRWNWPASIMETFGLMLLGVFTVSLDLLGNYLPMPKTTPFDQFFAHPRDAYLIAIFAVTFGPLMEELFFRGFLYPVLARRTGVVLAILLTALPFGFIHYFQYKSWAAVLLITLVGVVLTTVRAVTKSVAASFLVHAGYNGTLMAITIVATHGFRHMEKAAFFPFLQG